MSNPVIQLGAGHGRRTTCPYCGTGCGVLAEAGPGGLSVVRGDPEHPANRGRLCSKGSALGETTRPDGRLLHPVIDGHRVGWEDAIGAVAQRLSAIIDRHGPDSVAFYLSGQLLTEDYYVANKLMKGFIGSANVDTNSRLCMASTVAGHKRAFGADTVPGVYEDLELADLVVLVGSNLAWCHPVLHQRLLAARAARGTRVVVIDPRRTATAEDADLHLPLGPGSDIALFNGLLLRLARGGLTDRGFVDTHTTGLEGALASAMAEVPDVAAVADACDLPVEAIERFYGLFAGTERVVTVFSQGVNQSAQGTDTVNAIINTHLLTGRIGRPGMGPFSVTGQPNAMGGREVGGLANQLAAHMGFDAASIDRVRRFWNAPRVAETEGLKAVDLFDAVGDGRVKAVWIMATNPAVSLPDAERVRAALGRCELVIASETEADTDTLRHAHIRLPALAWGEKDGTVTNSDRTISRQRPFLAPPGEARADWWILSAVGRAMGWSDAFAYAGPAAVFREHAALSAFENGGSRDFDIGALTTATDDAYEALAPVRWPFPAGGVPAGRLFADGRFFTPDGRGRLVPVTGRPMARGLTDAFPLRLNTGRLRDQWHTMTRTGRSPRLSAHAPEPAVALHPADAAARGLKDGALASIATATGTAIARVRIEDGQRRGEVFLPMHWTDRFTASCVVGALIDGITDPFSGQPDSKRMPAEVTAFPTAWSGLLVSRAAVEPAAVPYWCRHAAAGCHMHELAGDGALPGLDDLDAWFGGFGAETVEYLDLARGVLRRAWFRDGRVEACVFLAAEGARLDRGWLVSLFAADAEAPSRLALLSGRPAVARPDEGRTVCACFGVGVTRIAAAIRDQELASVEAIGAALKAGTNCGSCIPELKALLAETRRCDAVA
ncbi:molybdopterin-dependent oxidoreductase [Azospirillum sp. RWY-5-1]|uniref:Molybdopterin-dependent oxidoreductase n=1 Tax=Azospirillum oleiclasticum TaxID=2735135 RepID=A0ABX2TEG0_9PROT|nr:nitrate reductase [Azospirillum oleiclasticum]NYZ14197.1 molybdopterin-dependent oxidoreductase [Azospirillum oleiclasticum]NYZ21681.1 molybdopterin-dependent oxidoreductase [Azospirillum oleiclasticum]